MLSNVACRLAPQLGTEWRRLAMTTTSTTTKYAGGCHCGAVRYEVELAAADGLAGTMCNCTVCTKIASVGAIVKPAAFRLISGDDSLSIYEWGGTIGQRT